MIDGIYERGFRPDSGISDYRIQKDEKGYFIKSLSENTQVYLNDFYTFLEDVHACATNELKLTREKLSKIQEDTCQDTAGYLRAKIIILKTLLKTVVRFYTESTTVGVIVTPWCFGTIVLERVDVRIDHIKKGEVTDDDIPKYPMYMITYMEEAGRRILLDVFKFPDEAFSMRWQYTELLRRYGDILENVKTSLTQVLDQLRDR